MQKRVHAAIWNGDGGPGRGLSNESQRSSQVVRGTRHADYHDAFSMHRRFAGKGTRYAAGVRAEVFVHPKPVNYNAVPTPLLDRHGASRLPFGRVSIFAEKKVYDCRHRLNVYPSQTVASGGGYCPAMHALEWVGGLSMRISFAFALCSLLVGRVLYRSGRKGPAVAIQDSNTDRARNPDREAK